MDWPEEGCCVSGQYWVVQTQNETLFIYLHSCAGLENYVEMTQFLIFDMLTSGQFINRERQFGNNIFFRTIAYVFHGGGGILTPHDKNFVILLIKLKYLSKCSLK